MWVFMGLLAPIEGDMPLLPSHILDGDGASALQSSPIGSGPWRFADRAEGGYVEYEANKDYWNMERVSPFDTLHISLVPEEDTRIALLKTGKLEVSPISTASISDVKSDGFAVDGPKNVISTAMRFFMGYDEDYLTSSLEFRKALAVSVNMPEIVAVNFARKRRPWRPAQRCSRRHRPAMSRLCLTTNTTLSRRARYWSRQATRANPSI